MAILPPERPGGRNNDKNMDAKKQDHPACSRGGVQDREIAAAWRFLNIFPDEYVSAVSAGASGLS
jgi:hypothetical protein